jgi:hypothetical protein
MLRLGLSCGEFRNLAGSDAGEYLGMGVHVDGARRATVASKSRPIVLWTVRSAATVWQRSKFLEVDVRAFFEGTSEVGR